MSDDTAGEARKGLFDSVAGKAKEVAGAVSGNDELTEEGQLQQADARARREANSQDAIADAKAKEAADQLRAEQQHAADQRDAADAQTAARARAVEQDAAARRTAVETAARRAEQAEQAAAGAAATQDVHDTLADAQTIRVEAQAAERDGTLDAGRLAAEAAHNDQRAAQLRAEATHS